MNMWQCILLGIGLALIMHLYKVYKAKKIEKELNKTLNEQLDNQVEDKK